MTERDDFDHRLGQGLKRWAEAGQPTMDLEAYVKARTPEPPGETTGMALIGSTAAKKYPRRWLRLAAGFAAAAAVALALTATFPSWAGATAGWPLVGPVVTEIILKDAGLKWAYDNGLIHGTLAVAKEGNVTVRILGAVADSRRTTVIYQIAGVPAHAADVRPVSSQPGWAPPRPTYPEIAIATVDGKGGPSAGNAPVETPVGLVGTVSTMPIGADSAQLVIRVSFAEKTVELPIEASRAEVDKVSREVAVNLSQDIGGIKIIVESVIYTPAETVIRYREEKADLDFGGFPVERSDQVFAESEGKRYDLSGSNMIVIGGEHIVAFPPVKGPLAFVVPVATRSEEVKLVWPLQTGATQQAGGTTFRLTNWGLTDRHVSFAWEYPASGGIVGFGTFEALDASGIAYPLGLQGYRGGNNHRSGGIMMREFATQLPADFTPVAVRARVIGHKVTGPWRFELPR